MLCSNLLPYECTSGKQNKHQVALSWCHSKLCVHWTLKARGHATWSKWAQIYAYAQEIKFCWHKSLTCPECAQLSLVYGSIHETVAKRFLRISVSQLHPKLRSILKKGRFHDTNATCPECSQIRLVSFRPSHVKLLASTHIQHES